MVTAGKPFVLRVKFNKCENMENSYKAEYTPSDYEMHMFSEMRGRYSSKNEEIFFETMLRKIQTEYAGMGEVILDEDDNEEGIYLHRDLYDDFVVGRSHERYPDHPVFTNGLFGILEIDLGEYILNEHITLLEWLRRRDYAGVRYDKWEG